ncbi:MAG: TIGR01459 family HAD-type hydrolase [Rhodospirillaceae bacterium]|nr:TIGR01459 family HAD-type hydrolase [Rhodospirillaceae bacterium]|tara:strand:+ start:201169 stop:202053 length:885 start_codon:yes stop_codon:yes gene_type:complete
MADEIPILPGLAELVAEYDAFIIDLWGVIHDGVTLYPGVVDCLSKVHETGKPYAMLTNAPRRSDAVRRGMNRMGVPAELCPIIMSSGEATRLGLEERREDWFDDVKLTYVHIGPDRDDGLFDNLDLRKVDSVAEAGLIVNTGPWRDEETVADYEPLLQDGAAAGVKMVCANPDLEVIRGGVRIICAGALARRYEELGGDVLYYGKPHSPIYESCLYQMGDPDPKRVLAIGDSLKTDITGACNLDMYSVLVTGGIHGDAFGIAAGDHSVAAGKKIAEICALEGVFPDAAIQSFCW